MKLSRVLFQAALVGTTAALTACGGGGGSGSVSTGGVYLSHAEVADEFVHRLNLDAGYDVTLVKTNTEQYNYVVVYDHDYNTYDAYDLGSYNVGEDINSYIYWHQDDFFYDLDPLTGNRFEDPYTGIVFEETSASSKDLEKMAALAQDIKIKKAADNIVAQYGLSVERATEVARLATQLTNAPKSSMTDADYDNFSKELLGSSITQFKDALKKQAKGDSAELVNLIDTAAEVNGVGPEHMNKIVTDLFAAQN